MAALRKRLERLRLGEEGLTIVEIVVAAMIMVVGGLGVLGLVDAATRNTFRAEQSQVVNNVLQRELEAIRQLPYEEVGLSSLPASESGENNPNSRISGADFYVNRSGSGLRSMVSGGALSAGPEPFEDEDVTGSIYRYVVWDACPGPPNPYACVDGNFVKRAIVAVKLDSTASGGSNRRYQEIQTQIVDPEAEPTDNPGPTPGGSAVKSWPLWLTDSTCERSEPQNPKERAEVEIESAEPGSHPTHNTRGVCADGMTKGNEPGAPDLLWWEAPDIEAESESPVYDYANDVEPKADPDRDKGLQLMLGGDCSAMPATTVANEPDSKPELFQKLHKWVTPPVDTADLALTGEGFLRLRTQSIEHGIYPATICIWLFVREGSIDTALTHTFGGLSYATYSAATWPNTKWAEIIVPLEFKLGKAGGEIPLPVGSRLGLALSVDDNSGSGIQTLYDEPTFDSRLVLDATGTLPIWP